MNYLIILILFIVIIFLIYFLMIKKKKISDDSSKKSESKEEVSEKKGETFIFESKITKSTQEKVVEVIINEEDFQGAKALLFIKKGKNSGLKFPLKQNVVNIGRDANNELVIDDIRASRNHAKIIFENDNFILQDNNSTNGTFLNNNRITISVLNDNDEIKIGDTIFVFKKSK